MSGLLDTGIGYSGTAVKGMIRSSELQTQRDIYNKQMEDRADVQSSNQSMQMLGVLTSMLGPMIGKMF